MAIGPLGLPGGEQHRRVLRLRLRQRHPGPDPEGLGALAAAVQAEVAAVLHVAASSLQVLGIYSAGPDATVADLAFRGPLLGQEAVAAAHVATEVARRATPIVEGDVVTAWSLLDGAEVQLVVGTPAGEPIVPYVPPPSLPVLPPVKPVVLDPQIEAILAQAQRIADRPKHNMRLYILGREEEKIKEQYRIEDMAAARLQSFWRRRQAEQEELWAIADLAATRIQRNWRWYTFLRDLRHVVAAIIRLQSWWRKVMAVQRYRIIRRRFHARCRFKGMVHAKIMAAKAARAFRKRRRMAIMVQAMWRRKRRRTSFARIFATSTVPLALQMERKRARRQWEELQELNKQAARAGQRGARALQASWRIASAMIQWARRARARCQSGAPRVQSRLSAPLHGASGSQRLSSGDRHALQSAYAHSQLPALPSWQGELRFGAARVSDLVHISADGLHAQHKGKADDLHGVVFLEGKIPRSEAEHANYFEVCIMETRQGESDGLTLGFASVMPASVPETAADIDEAWSIGFDGCACIAGTNDMPKVGWNPATLCEGDMVCFVAHDDGQAYLLVNGRRVAELPGRVTLKAGQPLLPFIDLLGNAREVSLMNRSLSIILASSAQPSSGSRASLQERGRGSGGDRLSSAQFDKLRASGQIKVSPDGTSARHLGSPGDFCGVVFIEGPLQRAPAGSRQVQVCVKEVRQGECDGLTLGVTSALPDPWLANLETADDVENSWSIGFDGAAHVDNENDLVKVAWNPKELQEGDVVTFVVLDTGQAHVLVNGTVVVKLPGQVDISQRLYGFIDLLGNTRSVMLMGPSSVPAPRLAGAPEAAPLVRLDVEANNILFDAIRASELVRISADGMSASHTGSAADLQGVIYTACPLPVRDGVRVLRVQLMEIRDGEADGLTLGVTTALPDPSAKSAETADDIDPSWSIGFDGVAHIDGDDEMLEVSWNPKDLRKDDVVAFVVQDSGKAYVLVNDVKMAELPGKVDTNQPLYGIVDLLGNARAVTLAPRAWNGAGGLEVPQLGSSAPPARTPEPSSLPCSSAPAASKTPQEPSSLPLRFDRVSCSDNVVIYADGSMAKHRGAAAELGGVVFTEFPLPHSDGTRVLEVRLVEVGDGEADGLTLGVTTALPDPSAERAETADDIDPSWSIGFDGVAHIDGEDEMLEVSWNPKDLQEGDVVAFVVQDSGKAYVLVNDVKMVELPGKVDTNQPLYGIVDLLGNARAVTLAPRAWNGAGGLEVPQLGSSAPPARRSPPEPSSLPLRFDRASCSDNVVIYEDGSMAKHRGAAAELGGVVFTEFPLPHSDGTRVLEVRLLEVGDGEADGLTLGVTTALPDPSAERAETADDIEPSWSIGFDGVAHIDGEDQMPEVSWNPKFLKKGDVVAFVVQDSGRAYVVVNDVEVAELPGKVETSGELYGIVDLLGNARAVALTGSRGAQRQPSNPPTHVGTPRAAIEAAPRWLDVHFDGAFCSDYVRLSSDGKVAAHTGSAEDLLGVLYTESALPQVDDTRALTVQLIDVRETEVDGLTIGVTKEPPDPLMEPAETADNIKDSWSIGFDGCAHIDGEMEMFEVMWNPKDLRKNDVVSFVVHDSGKAHVLVNGESVADLPGTVDTQGPLYGVVDLLGNAKAVALVPRTEDNLTQ